MTTILTHKRFIFEDKYCFSNIYFNGLFVCNTLEDADRGLSSNDSLEKIKIIKNFYPKSVAIPYGEYILGWRWSNSLSHKFADLKNKFPDLILKIDGIEGLLLPHIKDVKGFTYIMYHTGQFEYHSEGCPLTRINTIYGGYAGSREAFVKLLDKLYVVREDLFSGNAKIIIEKKVA